MRLILLPLIILFLACPESTGFQNLIKLGQAFMGDLLSTLPARLHCAGTGRNQTNFMLFTRVHPDRHRALVAGDESLLRRSDFDSQLPTKVLLHGFVDNMHISDWMVRMKNKLLAVDDYNVIIVDWSCGNDFPYFQAIQNSKTTAQELKKLIYFLQVSAGAEPSSFHLIGHSLGGHIAALVGHAVPHLGRISALDPAGPRFYDARLEDRLDSTDAEFVDVIHTDAGHGILEGMGLRAKLGHVDFYPNGGTHQPGCHGSPLNILPRIGLYRAARYYATCDHYRSIEYYLDSIRTPGAELGGSCRHVGVACRDWETYAQGRCADCRSHEDNCAVMGFPSDLHLGGHTSSHEYYIKTADDDPFCLFQYQVIVETGCGQNICGRNAEPGFKPGVIRLEVRTESGKLSRMDLDDTVEHELHSDSQYVYLATSRYPLGEAKGAKIWFGSLMKPQIPAPLVYSPQGLNIRKIEITPIELPEKINRLSHSGLTVFCGSTNRTLGRNQYLDLTLNSC